MAKVRVREGEWFAIPIDGFGYAAGVAARVSPGVLYGCFFFTEGNNFPKLDELCDLRASDADLRGRFGDLCIREGEWPVLGQCEKWERMEWAMPPLIRTELITERVFLAHYDDNDPNNLLWEERLPVGERGDNPSDSVMGCGSVANKLKKLLSSREEGYEELDT